MSAKQKEAEYRDNLIGTDFTVCPSEELLRVYITGEILSAENFPNTQLFISYKFTLPGGWKTQVPQDYDSLDLSPIELKEFNCLESMTQTVAPVLINKEEGGTTNRFYFSFPIDLQLIAKRKSSDIQWPTLHFQVFEKDSWDRIFFQGCGFLQVPSSPGTHTIQTQTWKPNLSYRTKVFQFFLGGLTRPKNIELISKSEDLTELDNRGPINRSLSNTISSGSIKTRLNIATQSKVVKQEQRMNFKVMKFSQEAQQLKEQSRSQIPSQLNTGMSIGGRFTTTNLNR